ncbi:hypothetical protein ACTXT7_000136 [Hymenolepis weldensis]
MARIILTTNEISVKYIQTQIYLDPAPDQGVVSNKAYQSLLEFTQGKFLKNCTIDIYISIKIWTLILRDRKSITLKEGNQNKVYPPLVASIVGNIVNFGSHYLFYHYTQYAFVGSALSQSLSFLGQFFVILVYIHVSKIYKKTWDAIHVELWHDWGIWFKLAIPGMMMLGLEWWVCESGSILAGIRGERYLAVQTILNNVESMLFCTFPLGFCISASIRIGQFVGANKVEGPISTALVALITIVCLCSMNAVLLLFTRSYIPRIFTNDV